MLLDFQPLYSVVVDHAEEVCYVGAYGGKIFKVDLLDSPRNVEQLPFDGSTKKGLFFGHEKSVTSLSISIAGNHLLSGK